MSEAYKELVKKLREAFATAAQVQVNIQYLAYLVGLADDHASHEEYEIDCVLCAEEKKEEEAVQVAMNQHPDWKNE